MIGATGKLNHSLGVEHTLFIRSCVDGCIEPDNFSAYNKGKEEEEGRAGREEGDEQKKSQS